MNSYNVIEKISNFLENSLDPARDIRLYVLQKDQRLVWVLQDMGHSLFSAEIENLFYNLELASGSPLFLSKVNELADRLPFYRLIDTYIYYRTPGFKSNPGSPRLFLDLKYHIEWRMSRPVTRPKNYLQGCLASYNKDIFFQAGINHDSI